MRRTVGLLIGVAIAISLGSKKTDPLQLSETQRELKAIETAVARMRVPLGFSNQLYDLRMHIDVVRQRLDHARGSRPASATP